MKSKKVTLPPVRVDEELLALIKKEADERDRSMAWIVRNALVDYFKAKGVGYER